MNKTFLYALAAIVLLLTGCTGKQEDTQSTATPKTLVEVTHVSKGSVADNLTFFATTLYLKRNMVSAPIPSFITKVNVKLGDRVNEGDVMYILQSKESRALGTDNTNIDPSLSGFGIIKVKAAAAGIISTLDRQQVGEYVLEGTQLCSIAESNDLVFQVNVPFQYTQYTKLGASCSITLPDNTILQAKFTRALTSMNITAQTQPIFAKSAKSLFLPENMVVKVTVDKNTSADRQILPKSCVLADEMMQNFWVMKIDSDSTAIKVPVTTGNKNEENIEILSPKFTSSDRIISTGNYGLGDKAAVEIKKQKQ